MRLILLLTLATCRTLDLLPWECFEADVWRRPDSTAWGWAALPRRRRFLLRWYAYRRWLDARRERAA